MDAVVVSALARHLLTVVGGAAMAKYGIDGGTVETAAGGLAALAGIIWSVYDKKKKKAQ